MIKYNFLVTYIDPINKKYERWQTSVEDLNDVEFFAWREIVDRAVNNCDHGFYINSIRLLGMESD